MPLRTPCRPVITAARLGVQDGSVYIRVKLMPSAARRLMFGVSQPRCFWMKGTPTSPTGVSSNMI
jgi:hypothetical protein